MSHIRQIGLTYLALLLLLGLTIGTSFLELGMGNALINLAVAAAKAALIAAVFMELISSGPLTRLAVAAVGLWLLILYGLTLSDYLTR